MTFHLFDPDAEVEITHGQLPHWYQPGVTYFVTFRTEDSVPKKLADDWYRRREVWLLQHEVDPASKDWQIKLDQNSTVSQAYHKLFTREFMEYLDRGLGRCVLRNPTLAGIVADCLKHFDGERYDLGDFVIMPNHVHLLVALNGTTDLEEQCYSWKKYSATKINRTLGTSGRFWQSESFDHLVRSPEQFEHFQRYIAENPTKAGLRPGDYLHFPLAK